MGLSMKFTVFSANGLVCVGLCLFSAAEAADSVTVATCVCHRGELMAPPLVTLESGQSATLQVGEFELTICPTTIQDGKTVITSTLTTDTDAVERVTLTPPIAVVSAGKSDTVSVGAWDVRFTATVAE